MGGAVSIAQTGISTGDQALALIIFVAIASAGVGIPFTLRLSLGDRATHALEGIKTWMAANNDAIMAVVLLVIGSKLLGDGIGTLRTDIYEPPATLDIAPTATTHLLRTRGQPNGR